MPSNLDWHGDAITAQIKAELRRRIHQCCILVYNRAKELLNVDGTGIAAESEFRKRVKANKEARRADKKARKGIAAATRRTNARARREKFAAARAEAKGFNEAHKAGISIGKIKRLRVTKAGTLSNRRKPTKKA